MDIMKIIRVNPDVCFQLVAVSLSLMMEIHQDTSRLLTIHQTTPKISTVCG